MSYDNLSEKEILLDILDEDTCEYIANNLAGYAEIMDMIQPDPENEKEFAKAIKNVKKVAENIRKRKKLDKIFNIDWVLEHEEHCRKIGKR